MAHPDLWATVGAALYQEATIRAEQRGIVAMVTIASHLDAPKRAMLQAQDASITVETYVQSLRKPQ